MVLLLWCGGWEAWEVTALAFQIVMPGLRGEVGVHPWVVSNGKDWIGVVQLM